MRHLKRTAKLGRTGPHRNAMLANLVCSLIKHKRVTTTLAKAKAARSVAEKILFNEIAPAQKERHGGYTRIVRLNQRQGDAAQRAILEWVDLPLQAPETAAEAEPAEAAKPDETKTAGA